MSENSSPNYLMRETYSFNDLDRSYPLHKRSLKEEMFLISRSSEYVIPPADRMSQTPKRSLDPLRQTQGWPL
jgi:hypothetical protein